MRSRRSAQRAARLLARSGHVRLAHVRVPTTRGRRSAELLVIGRTEVDLRTVTDEAMKTAAIRRVAPADRTSEALDIIMETVCQAAAHVADVDLHTLDIDAAGQAAQNPRLPATAAHPVAPVTPDAPTPTVVNPTVPIA
jgi:hypothetical protein